MSNGAWGLHHVLPTNPGLLDCYIVGCLDYARRFIGRPYLALARASAHPARAFINQAAGNSWAGGNLQSERKMQIVNKAVRRTAPYKNVLNRHFMNKFSELPSACCSPKNRTSQTTSQTWQRSLSPFICCQQHTVPLTPNPRRFN